MPPVDSIVEYAAYVEGRKIDRLRHRRVPWTWSAGTTRTPTAPKAFVWVGLHEPAAPEVEWLAEVFGLHPLAVEDAVKAHQRPKVERYGDSLFMVLKTIAYLDHDELTATSEIIATGEIMVFVGPDFVVTVRHGGHCPLVGGARAPGGQARAARPRPGRRAARHRRPRRGPVPSGGRPDAAELEEVEATVFADVSSRDIDRIYQLKREMIELKRAVTPLQAPLSALPQRRVIPSEMREYFRDVGDHLSRVCEQVESSNELCSSILQAALARSNALANEDMRKISSWVAILAVPTMIAGIYGMNFDFMPETNAGLGLSGRARP